MNLADGRLAPAPGADGLVCRTRGAVLFVAARTPAVEAARLVDEVRAHDDDQPARALARQLAVLVGADTDTALPGFALVAASEGGIYVKAYGSVEVHLQGEGGTEVVSAVGSFTGVDRELPGPFHTIAAHRAGEPTPAPAFDVDLHSGTTTGAGFALTTLAGPTDAVAAGTVADASAPATASDAPVTATATPTDAPATATAGPITATSVTATDTAAAEEAPTPSGVEVPTQAWRPSTEDLAVASGPATLPPTAMAEAGVGGVGGGFTSQLLGALDDEEPDVREPLPTEPDPSQVRAAEQQTSEVLVQGVVCPRGHFNDPRSRFCSSCGVSMADTTQILTRGPRPPLGVLVLEDGATFSLSTDYVVGRQPEASPLVQSGDALPLPIDDPERSISRAHAEVRLVDWDAHLVNLSETNGSFVWDPTSNQWIPIPAGQSVMLTPGMRVALGRRSAVFESALVR